MDAVALRDLFQELGAIQIRRMFGGLGVYHDGVMFALVAGGELYLKTDDATRPTFEAAASRPFLYERKGQPVALSYWLLPSEAFDDPSEAARWARLALRATRTAKPKRGRRAVG